MQCRVEYIICILYTQNMYKNPRLETKPLLISKVGMIISESNRNQKHASIKAQQYASTRSDSIGQFERQIKENNNATTWALKHSAARLQ